MPKVKITNLVRPTIRIFVLLRMSDYFCLPSNLCQEKDEQKESPKTSSAQSNAVFYYTQCDANKTQFTIPVETALCKKTDAGDIRRYSHTAVSACQSNAENAVCQGPSFVSTQPSVTVDQDHSQIEAEKHGKAIG